MELIQKIEDELGNPLNAKKKIPQICLELGLRDTMIFYDPVIEAMHQAYEFYTIKEQAFIPIPDIWYEYVNIKNKFQPRLF